MWLVLVFACAVASAAAKSPNIVLIVADDMGFNDVSYRGSVDIPTPNIDALAYAGRILDRHYVLPTCTPSRSSLLTGRYALRTGMQGYPLKTGERRALPQRFKLLPEYLKQLNYSTHLVGKWHQGFYHWSHTPTFRGFDSFLGYYNGFIGYFQHDVQMSGYVSKPGEDPAIGVDMHRGQSVASDVQGTYATELFTAEVERIISSHDKEKPLFIDLSHLAVHTGMNGTQVEVEDQKRNDDTFSFIQDSARRNVAGAMASLDDSVGRVVRALAHKGMLQDTIILLMTDNGGETVGQHANAASNYPLRGQKFTQFEGGVRGSAVIWHADMPPASELHSDLIHISDWLPTFYEAAGGKLSDLDDIDGVSHWKRLLGRNSTPPRSELVVNIESLEADPTFVGRSYIDGWWKLVWNVLYPSLSKLGGDPGSSPGAPSYDVHAVLNSTTAGYLRAATRHGDHCDWAERAARLRSLATVRPECRHNAFEKVPACEQGCLFNLELDACEGRDVAAEHPDIVATLKEKLLLWQNRTVPQLNTFVDAKSDPRLYGHTWVPWEDIQQQQKLVA